MGGWGVVCCAANTPQRGQNAEGIRAPGEDVRGGASHPPDTRRCGYSMTLVDSARSRRKIRRTGGISDSRTTTSMSTQMRAMLSG